MDYKNTINLPKTAFPMKASLPRKEPEMLQHWQDSGLYEKIRQARAGADSFILHDGPPYANGSIHIGHALNKILKDIIIKSKTMSGCSTLYVPGWDCHGLPIEINVEKQLGKQKNSLSKQEIRRSCRAYAEKHVDIQREEFKRLGVFGEWAAPYLTMSPAYTAAIVREFARFVDTGDLYKQKKPIQWCASCRTALAEAEVEYRDESSPSIYVKFPVVSDIAEQIPGLQGAVSVLIWTTTPWTIPANLAVCLHPDFDYVAVRAGNDILILAEGLLNRTMLACDIQGFEILNRFPGRDIEGVRCRHPLYERESPLILGDHVTLEAGTGCVHTAPGHGQEDYVAGMRYGLDIYAPVDDRGCFTGDAGSLAGEFVFAANERINDMLREAGALLKEEHISHSYPHCWRCKKPVIFRATEQWFVSMDKNGLRTKALDCIAGARWIPRWGRERITGMVENRPDWCISRQRSWGVPIVAFYCGDCGGLLLDSAIVNHVAGLFEREGSDIWFSEPAETLLPDGTVCPSCGSASFDKETDILDVWFDSGVSHAAVLEQRRELASPCDMYLEGSDQHRGWFQSSLLTAVGTRGQAPYRSVLTHGFVVDGKGEKMAKSKGNVISPDKIIKQYGAEIIRLWVASENYQEDMRISQDILKRLSEAYRKIRNTCRFMLGTLADFDPARDAVPYAELSEIDRWALMRLNTVIRKVLPAYETYEFHTVYHSLLNFCIIDMSAVYLDILKDRLYCSAPEAPERRAAQSTIYTVLKSLLELLAPVLSFTADEAWAAMPGTPLESVHLSTFPAPEESFDNADLEKTWAVLLKLRECVLKELETARENKQIGNSLEAAVSLRLPSGLFDIVQRYENELPDLCIVSQVSLQRSDDRERFSVETMTQDIELTVARAGGTKCLRCWKVLPDDEYNGHPDVCERCSEALQSPAYVQNS